ncbi:valine--tRNA ligase [Patescibacteria group bacterium]|nr:valine--tRNA ligase [Patescibacteria group bacterium]
MEKVYDHNKFEDKIYKLWEDTKSFTPEVSNKKKPFCIIMPPPNANENLHVGHARFVAIEDILIRFYKMKGYSALWLPGADHAGIETQYVFEKKLREQGKSRFEFDRDTLYKMIWDYVQLNKKNMESQIRKLGASCDWSRNTFTLDPKIIKTVYKTFKKLYDDDLIYRGEKIVNYCTKCGTAYSQLEVNSVEREDNLYFLDYGTIKIATTRPETIFADVAVAVNPKDKRYKSLIGKNAKLPLVGRELPIISDILVDPKFGTGALKITPGHDETDLEIGKKHNLSTINVIDGSGRMINTPQKYIGLTAFKAREEVIKDLEKEKKLIKIEKIKHFVGICYKDKSIIEPKISKQWFIKMKPLTQKALKSISNNEVDIVTKKYEKIAKYWLKNLKDWNISRQIVWGIQIPAWKCKDCLEWTITDGKTPLKCSNCNSSNLKQDTDTFDTWFSSAQWPFATLKIKKGDFDYFYPTTVMETGYDIIPFWVIRMIMVGIYVTGKVPFTKVLIHGLVRDKFGVKISKSKGNVINPLEMVEKYGSDALRMSMVWGALIENDISLSEENINGQRRFANKVWNISRFILDGNIKPSKSSIQNEDDKWIIKELNKTIDKVSSLIEKYKLSEAAYEIYDFIWHKFADIYLEKIKNRKNEAYKTLVFVLKKSLQLLHPFMPFLTEKIWQIGFFEKEKTLLINSSWPK